MKGIGSNHLREFRHRVKIRAYLAVFFGTNDSTKRNYKKQPRLKYYQESSEK